MNASTAEPKRIPDVSVLISDDNEDLRVTFKDGRAIAFNIRQLNEEMKAHALMHGIKQKLIDAAAIGRNPDTGRTADLNDKFDAISEVYERITRKENPQWNKVREGGASNLGGLLLRALIRQYAGRKTPEQLKEWLSTKSPEQQSALRASPAIAEIIAELRKEKADPTVGDALLNELEGE